MLSDIAADHVHNPRNRGPMEGATHFGTCGIRGDGPYVEIWLEIESETIKRATYRTPGCPSSTAAASMTCQLMIGRTVEQAKLLQAGDLLKFLGGLPEGKEEYAAMSVKALNAALAGKLDQVTEESDTATPRTTEPGGPAQKEQVA